MEQTKSACIALVAVFLLCIGAESVVQAVSDARAGNAPSALDIFKRAPSPAILRAYEDGLREQSVIANAIRPWLQFWRFSVMSDAGKNGLVGRDGWLFYKPGVQFLVEPWAPSAGPDDPIDAIVSFRDQLETRGAKLLIFIAPGKESVYPNQLARRASGPVNGHVEKVVAKLRERGVEVYYNVDAGEDAHDAYLAQDTHWTPARARAVAEDIAALALEKQWVQRGAVEYRERVVALERHGDILRMAKSAPLLRAHAPERMTAWQVTDASGQPYRDAADAPVLVLGDSFLRIFQSDEPTGAGFIAHLARALRMPVTEIVNDGGASTLVRQELRRKPELLSGKKLVIWEFVDRDLRFGTDGWKMVELPAP